jgi:hypothetical protein
VNDVPPGRLPDRERFRLRFFAGKAKNTRENRQARLQRNLGFNLA